MFQSFQWVRKRRKFRGSYIKKFPKSTSKIKAPFRMYMVKGLFSIAKNGKAYYWLLMTIFNVIFLEKGGAKIMRKSMLVKVFLIGLSLMLVASIYVPGNTNANTVNNQLLDSSELIAYPNFFGGIYKNSLQIKLYSSQAATIYYTTNGSDPTTSSTKYVTPINITNEGLTTIKYFAKDNEGDVTPIYQESYIIDHTAPTVMAFPSGGTYNHNIRLTLSLPETGDIYYTLNGTTPTKNSNKYTTPILLNEGTRTIRYMGVDEAGNQSNIYEQTYTIDLDSTISALPSSSISNQSLAITLASTKTGTFYYTTNGSTPTTSSSRYTGPINITAEGITTLKYIFVDSQGTTSSTNTEYYLLENNPPETLFLINGLKGYNDWYVGDVAIKLLAKDKLNQGLVETLYSLNGQQWQKYDGSITVTKEGLNTIYYYSKDIAGYNEGIKKETFKIDKTGPVVNIYSPKSGYNYSLNAALYANWTATDNISGLDTTLATAQNGVQINTNTKGEKEFKVLAKDKAGNSTEVKSIYYVDYVSDDPIVDDEIIDVRPPLYLDQINELNQGRTIPIKFRVNDSSFDSSKFALYLAKIDDNGVGKEQQVLPSSKAKTSSIFKYEKNDKQYSYNLSTKNMSKGLWQLRIELDKTHSVYITLLLR